MRWIVMAACLLMAMPAYADDIFDAARAGDVRAIGAYHAAKGDLEVRTGRGYTPFILAAYHGQDAALAELKKDGAKLCALDEAGNTALMGVAYQGHRSTAKWLLENTPCPVNHQNGAGQTALMMALLFGREEIIQLLLAKGADASLQDAKGNTAASLAQSQGLDKIVQKLTFPLQKGK